MNSVVQKKLLKDGYYYSGYIHQHYCAISENQPMTIGMWDLKNNCFWFWEYDGNRKTKSSIEYMLDITNEIEYGFFPLKEIIPKDEHIIE